MTTIEKPIYKDKMQDNEIKQELKTLASSIDIAEKGFSSIDKLFDKLNTMEEDKKTLALQYALNDSPIKVGSGGEKKLGEIAKVFDKAVEQDESTRKIRIKNDITITEDEISLIQPFLNEKNSALAYLVQKSSNFIKLQAQRGYGKESEKLENIGIDKIFGNQTKRALNGLQSWIDSDISKKFDSTEAIKELTVEDILAMKYISKDLKESIMKDGSDPVNTLWENIGTEKSEYTFLAPHTNNYAIKKINSLDNEEDGVTEGKEAASTSESEEKSNNQGTQEKHSGNKESERKNHHEDYPNMIEDRGVAEGIKSDIEELGKQVIDVYGKKYELHIDYPVERISTSGGMYGGGTQKINKYDALVFKIGEADTSLPLSQLLDKEGNFDNNYRKKTLLPQIQNTLKENLTAINVAKKLRGNIYKKTDIFPEKIKNKIKESKIKTYFSLFDDKELLIDKSPQYTNAKEGNVYIRLNDNNRDEKFNKPTENKDLIVKGMDLVDSSGELSEDKLKDKLKSIIESITENYM